MLEERQENVEPSGAFDPAAALWLSPGLARSGLLRELSPEEAHLLLGVLCSLTPNGAFAATPHSVAAALGVAPRAARDRLDRLLTRKWRGGPLLLAYEAGGGLRYFAPSPHLLERRRHRIAPAHEGGMFWPEDNETGHKERVSREIAVNSSRARYARPRAEVETDIGRFLGGHDAFRRPIAQQTGGAALPAAPADTGQGPDGDQAPDAQPEAWQRLALKRDLARLGMPPHQAGELLRLYPLERIRRQLDWLPERNAHNPVAYLLAAVAGSYRAPSSRAEPLPEPEKATTQEREDNAR